MDYSAWSANDTRSGGFQSVPNAPGERDMPAPPGLLGEEDLTEEEDARLVLGDEEEMLGEGGKGKEKGLPQQPQGRFRDEDQ